MCSSQSALTILVSRRLHVSRTVLGVPIPNLGGGPLDLDSNDSGRLELGLAWIVAVPPPVVADAAPDLVRDGLQTSLGFVAGAVLGVPEDAGRFELDVVVVRIERNAVKGVRCGSARLRSVAAGRAFLLAEAGPSQLEETYT
jgi:hypothetical protein